MALRPSLGWRLFNAARRWFEDRHVEPATYLQQMRRWWQPARRARVTYLNLRVMRSAKRRVA